MYKLCFEGNEGRILALHAVCRMAKGNHLPMIPGRTLAGRVLGCNLQRIELSRFFMFPSTMAALLQTLMDNNMVKQTDCIIPLVFQVVC